MFRRCFTGLDEAKVSILYQSLVRPALEYASTVWSLQTKNDIEALEKVQNRCLCLCKKDIQMDSLKERKERTEIIDTYKFLNGLYKTPADTYFSLPHKDLRGHSQKLFWRRSRTQIANHFYSNRVVKNWNALPEFAVSAPTVTLFKKILRDLPIGQKV